jgi:hypothetical protein
MQMTTEQTITTPEAQETLTVDSQNTPTSDAPSDESMKLANAEVREYANRTAAENKTLRAGAMKGALADIGLTASEGLGVAIVDSYEGEITTELVAAYAQEKYSFTAANAESPPAVESGDKLEALDAVSSPVTPPVEVDPAAEATAKMHDPESGRTEAIESLNAKMNQFQQEHY